MPRNPSIDILKCFAAVLITNSHMDILYHPYDFLATGGAIGDVLFFFCSGFTLFLGKTIRFDNWYKKRIYRIYPTIFAVALYSSIIFNKNYNITDLLINGGGWFVACIMIYYIPLYFIKRYWIKQVNVAFIIAAIITIIWYLFENRSTIFMYGNTFFKWCHYFLFMLLGAIIGKSKKEWNFSLKQDSISLIISIILYYIILFAGEKNEIISQFQILSLIPLLSITIYFFKICNSQFILKLAKTKIIDWLITLIATLTLEIYLVQATMFTDKMNNIFPFNIPLMFVAIIIVAYFIKILSRLFTQTFSENQYIWKEIFKIK